ncbi:MAG: J domain-containing protein [Fusobacteriaceae bacterium]
MIGIIFMAIIFFVIIGIITGKSLNFLPLILILFIVLMFVFGVQMIGFLLSNPWILIIILGVYMLSKKNKSKNPRKGAKFYYYKSGNQTNKDFEEFFKQAGEGFQYGNTNSNGHQGNFSGFRDKSADYKKLGIVEGATKEEIKKAYRDKAKQHHPDKFMNATEKERIVHEKMFKEANESYENIMKDFN